jgi:hypothetical protein
MLAPLTGRRARLAALAAAAACAVTLLADDCCAAAPLRAEAAVPDRGLDAAGYVKVAVQLERSLDALWDEQAGRYEPGPGATVTEVNADLLLVHAVAARRGLSGPLRDDRRARAIVRFLTGPQVWTDRPLPGAAPAKGPGWRAAPDHPSQHMVFETEAADGLVHAYLARAQLGLDAASVARIRDQIARVAGSVDWRWPALRLNQINWYCAILAADATVNGATAALASGMARHLERFLGGVGSPGGGVATAAGNLGPGLRFHYLPARGLGAKMNIDSAEYANIVLGFGRFYGQARSAGMPAPARIGLLREWVRRVIAGYWTHAGYLNWDTGLGFARWQQRKKAAISQLALLGIATEPELAPGPAWGAWAKWLLDAGLREYAALTARDGRVPAAVAYDVHVMPQTRGTAYLAAARYAANAMRALEAGLGRAPAAEPPALYSFDPDTGRLAVTTPSYNTAIVAVDQHAFPYGGIDLARLFDARQEVAGSTGGMGSAAFGLRVRADDGRTLLRTQYGTRPYAPGVTPLTLVRAPRGAGVSASAAIGEAYAGPFTDLRVRGSVRASGLLATSEYRFTRGWIDGRWTLAGRPASGTQAGVTFPSWGRGARVLATLADGRTVVLGSRPLALARVRSLHVVSARSGYVVTPLSRPAGAAVRLLAVRPQAADPEPGPSLELVLAPGANRFAARIAVD